MTDEEIDIEDSGGLFEHFRFKVDKGQSLLRIDKFVADRIASASRTKVQAASGADCLLVNGNPVKSSYRIKPLDEISVVMPFEKREFELVPENIPLDIVYEDDDLLVVDKPAGMVVHPGFGNYSGTLVNALLYHLEQQHKQHNDVIQDDERGGLLVHRIDKNTSGLLVAAKNASARARLAKQFFDHTTRRKYTALVWGAFDDREGTVGGFIGRNPQDRMRMKIFDSPECGKRAVTRYRVMEEFGYVSLIECVLETGRTHQIRAHMEHLGHPIFNDERYGGDRILRGTTFAKYRQFVHNCFELMPRQALHAGVLGFRHPSTGAELMFESPLPPEMNEVVERWRNYTKNRIQHENHELV